MNIYELNDYKDITTSQDAVLVLGYFDGLHLGHKALFDRAKIIAKEDNLDVTVLTFNASPRLALSRYSPDLLCQLTSPELRYGKFAAYGVDNLYLTDFTSSFAKLSSDAFLNLFVKPLRAKAIVVGFDYRFGHDRKSASDLAQQFDGEVVIVPEVTDKGEKISSTRIRHLLETGQVKEANRLLGYDFQTSGLVVHGDARGRTIGFPTANLIPQDRVLLPQYGVYVTDAIVRGKRYRSMTSIGKNITFGGTELRLEVNIFDFNSDIYGEHIDVIWLEKIRDMVNFSSMKALTTQLHQDKSFSLKL